MNESGASSRRDFLQGKAAAAALGEWADSLSHAAAAGDWRPEGLPDDAEVSLVRLERRAMACQFEFVFNAGQHPASTAAGLAALDLVDRLEDQLSVYRPHSEISQINARAFDDPVPVEPRLFALLETALELSRQTRGAFDITAGPLSAAWGFSRRAGAMPSEAEIASALQRVGSRYLSLDPAEGTIRFERPALQINLGAIGKGYALDRAAELLAAEGVADFLLHGGHSSVLARGAHGGLPRDAGWMIGVRDPLRPERRLGRLLARDQALATSGSGTQFFVHQGRRFGHILDPRSGWPAQGVLSSTVVAPTAAEADALSTAFYVLGPEAAAEICAMRNAVGCVLACPAARAGELQIHVHGLALGQWLAEAS